MAALWQRDVQQRSRADDCMDQKPNHQIQRFFVFFVFLFFCFFVFFCFCFCFCFFLNDKRIFNKWGSVSKTAIIQEYSSPTAEKHKGSCDCVTGNIKITKTTMRILPQIARRTPEHTNPAT